MFSDLLFGKAFLTLYTVDGSLQEITDRNLQLIKKKLY